MVVALNFLVRWTKSAYRKFHRSATFRKYTTTKEPRISKFFRSIGARFEVVFGRNFEESSRPTRALASWPLLRPIWRSHLSFGSVKVWAILRVISCQVVWSFVLSWVNHLPHCIFLKTPICIPLLVQRVLGGVLDACSRVPHDIDVFN